MPVILSLIEAVSIRLDNREIKYNVDLDTQGRRNVDDW